MTDLFTTRNYEKTIKYSAYTPLTVSISLLIASYRTNLQEVITITMPDTFEYLIMRDQEFSAFDVGRGDPFTKHTTQVIYICGTLEIAKREYDSIVSSLSSDDPTIETVVRDADRQELHEVHLWQNIPGRPSKHIGRYYIQQAMRKDA